MIKITRVQGDAGKNLDAALKALNGKVGKVGWFQNARYPNPPHEYVAQIASQNEFGVPARNIPSRPFMRDTIRERKAAWQLLAESGARAILKGGNTVDQVLEGLGQRAKGDIQATLSRGDFTPLSPVTIARRLERHRVGNAWGIAHKVVKGERLSKAESNSLGLLDKPLIDTRHMFNTITNVVEAE